MVNNCLRSDQPVCGVIAPTGSGKSLGIPNLLAKAGYRVYVSVPTITAALSLYTRQKELLADEGIYMDLGYSVEGEKHYTQKSQIVYATSGHWRKRILHLHSRQAKGKTLWSDTDFCDVFILDEIHTGTVDNDLIQDFFAAARAEGRKVPLLMLASATISPWKDLPFVQFDVISHPVRVEYTEVFMGLESGPSLYQAVVDRVMKSSDEEGDILIFVAGANDIETICEMIEDKTDRFVVLPAYASLANEDISRIYAPADRRKCVVATNIAESSITIPGIGCVLDTLQEKRALVNRGGGRALKTSFVSKSSADQRKGRTGRDRPGICVRFTASAYYDNFIEDTRPPEITRVPLESVILELLGVSIEPSLIAHRVKIADIQVSLKLLIALGMIDASHKVTEKGIFSAYLPLGVRSSSILYEWQKAGRDIYVALVFLALIDCYGPGYIWIPRSAKGEERKFITDKFGKFKSSYEIVAYAKIWNLLMRKSGGLFGDGHRFNTQCMTFSLHSRKCSEVRSLLRQLVSHFNESGVRIALSSFDEEKALLELIPYFNVAFDGSVYKRHHRSHDKFYPVSADANPAFLDRKMILGQQGEDTNEVVALTVMSITNARGTIDLISLYVPYEVKPDPLYLALLPMIGLLDD